MKVLFVYVDFMKGAEGKYYEGLASLSAVLKADGHSTAMLHLTRPASPRQFTDMFLPRSVDCGLVAFSATTHAFPYAARFAGEIKRMFPRIVSVCGGVHPTLSPEESIAADGFDVICVGEGEYPLRELCSSLDAKRDITAIPNLWVKRDGVVHKNPPRPLIEDLDSLPFPDRTLFTYEKTSDFRMGRLAFMGSRGCPYQCAHCCNQAIRKACLYPRPDFRRKSPGRLIQEIKDEWNRIGTTEAIGHICFHDDILTIDKPWFEEFASRYAEEIGLPYVCNGRFELLDEETVGRLSRSGCLEIRIGLESGDETIRKNVLKRNQDDETILETARLCRAKGIRLYLFVMVGLPAENIARVLRTVKLAARARPDTIRVSIYYPYHGTSLYDLCLEKGLLRRVRLDSYLERDSALQLPDFPLRDVLFAFDHMTDFVRLYRAAFRLPRRFCAFSEKALDFIWLNPLARGVLPAFFACGRFVKRTLIGRRGADGGGPPPRSRRTRTRRPNRHRAWNPFR